MSAAPDFLHVPSEAGFLACAPEIRHLAAIRDALVFAEREIMAALGMTRSIEPTLEAARAALATQTIRERSAGLDIIGAAQRAVDRILDHHVERAAAVRAASLEGMVLKADLVRQEVPDQDGISMPMASSLADDALAYAEATGWVTDRPNPAPPSPLRGEVETGPPEVNETPDGNLLAISRAAHLMRAEVKRLEAGTQAGGEGDDHETVYQSWIGLCRSLAALPATTPAGLRAKVQVLAWIEEDDPKAAALGITGTTDGRVAWSIARDLVRDAGLVAREGAQ